MNDEPQLKQSDPNLDSNSNPNPVKKHRKLSRKTIVWIVVAVIVMAALGQKQQHTNVQNTTKAPNTQVAQRSDVKPNSDNNSNQNQNQAPANQPDNKSDNKPADDKASNPAKPDTKPAVAPAKPPVNHSAKPANQSSNGGGYRSLPHCRVTHVSDGDTLTVDCLPTRVRLVGVDTPESTIKKQCYGKEASNYTKQLLGQSVYVETDPASGDLDRYGRPLRYIILEDGTNYNQKLIELGYGMLYVFNHQQFKYKDAFAAAEQRAHGANLGLWGACQTAINKYGNYHVTN